jgi:hypothetical protein
LRRGCAAREISIGASHGTLADKGRDISVAAAWLDPGKKITERFHEVEISIIGYTAGLVSTSCKPV